MAKEYEIDKKTLDGVQNVTLGELALDIADLKAEVEDLLARIKKIENK